MSTKRSDIYIQVIYGWFGKVIGSEGFIKFAQQLRDMGYVVSDALVAQQAGEIAYRLDSAPQRRKAVLGFSLGASSIAWSSQYLKKPVDLGVAYDPSIWAHGTRAVSPLIRRCIVYRVGWSLNPYGHAYLTGPTVETIETHGDHFRISHRKDLHAITLKALAALEQSDAG